MRLRRAARILLSRWYVILLAGLVGAALALGLATLYNQSIHPRFEANAGVTFIQLDRETDSAFKARLEGARSTALSVTATDPDAGALEIKTDPDTGVVSFIASAETGDAAKALSIHFRDEYLAAEPSSTIVEQITTRLATLRTEVADLESQLAAKEAVPSIQPDTQALRDLLSSKLSELRQQAASLNMQLAVPELAETDSGTLRQQLFYTERLVRELSAALEALPSPATVDANGDVPSNLDVLVLQRRLDDLQSQYIDLSLRLIDLGASGDLNEDVSVANRTPTSVSRRTAGTGGLVVGLVAAAALLLLLDTARRPLRGVDDVTSVPSLGLVEPADSGERGRLPWYTKDTRTGRKQQIQAVRSALDGALTPGSSLGVLPLHATVDDARLLAADLGASVAATGRDVLLVDATFSDGVDIAEYGDEDATLTDLLSVETPDRQSDLVGLGEVMKGLRGIRSGSGAKDPADLVAGQRFGGLLDDAASLGFAVIVAMPPADSVVTKELTQRLDRVLLAGRAGRTTEREVATVVSDLSARRAHPVGAVLLTGSERLKPRRTPAPTDGEPTTVDAPRWKRSRGSRAPEASAVEWDELSGSGGGPARSGSSDAATDTVANGAVTTLPVGVIDVDESLLLLIPDEDLPQAAERFLAAAVAALVDAEGGLVDVPRLLVDTEGMVPVTSGLRSPTVAERLVQLLPDRLAALPQPLASAVTDVLGCSVGLDSGAECRERIDAWVRERFDQVAGPTVWHLSSLHGTVQLLVNAKTFDAEHVRLLHAHDLRRMRVRLGRLAGSSVEPDGAVTELADVSAFDAALRDLLAMAERSDGVFDWHEALTRAGLLVELRG